MTNTHAVHLSAPDMVLIERYAGKRIDSVTGGVCFVYKQQALTPPSNYLLPDVYHLVFNPPPSAEVASRLVQEPGGEEVNLRRKLELYHRHSADLLVCYASVAKKFNADQPLSDILSQGWCPLGLGMTKLLPPPPIPQCKVSCAPSSALLPPTHLGYCCLGPQVVGKVYRQHSLQGSIAWWMVRFGI